MPDIVTVSVDTRSSGGEAHDPSDRYTSHEPTYVELYDVSASLQTISDKEYDELVKQAGDDYSMVWGNSYTINLESPLPVSWGGSVFVVIVRYQSGDTFGYTTGLAQVYDVFANHEDAEALAAAIRQDANTKYEPRNGVIMEWSLTHEGRQYHKCWVGYFERFEDATVHTVTIR